MSTDYVIDELPGGESASSSGGKRSRKQKAGIALSVALAITVVGVAGAAIGAKMADDSAQATSPKAQPETNQGLEDKQADLDSDTGWDAVLAFNQATEVEEMVPYVSPGSPAARWMKALQNEEATYKAAGLEYGGWNKEVIGNEAAGTITTRFVGGSTNVTKDYMSDGSGLIVSWSNEAGVPIADRLWAENSTGSGAGQIVTVNSARGTEFGGLSVDVNITAGSGDTPDWEPIYIGPDGVAAKITYIPRSTINSGSGVVAKALYEFDEAEFGGTLIYQARNNQTGATAEIALPIR